VDRGLLGIVGLDNESVRAEVVEKFRLEKPVELIFEFA
jgi:hypothetical protein